jgi:DivIVA domain-containing protein
MKISPMDIQRQTFGQRFRGLDPDEVRAYLNIVAEEVAALQMERDRLDRSFRPPIDRRAPQRETILKNTLLTAQRVQEILTTRAREAETTVKEAEMQADRLVELGPEPGPRRARHLDLRAHRSAAHHVRALITRLRPFDLQEEAELEDNLRFLKRREEAQ